MGGRNRVGVYKEKNKLNSFPIPTSTKIMHFQFHYSNSLNSNSKTFRKEK